MGGESRPAGPGLYEEHVGDGLHPSNKEGEGIGEFMGIVREIDEARLVLAVDRRLKDLITAPPITLGRGHHDRPRSRIAVSWTRGARPTIAKRAAASRAPGSGWLRGPPVGRRQIAAGRSGPSLGT